MISFPMKGGCPGLRALSLALETSRFAPGEGLKGGRRYPLITRSHHHTTHQHITHATATDKGRHKAVGFLPETRPRSPILKDMDNPAAWRPPAGSGSISRTPDGQLEGD